jgi:hypothetical protein
MTNQTTSVKKLFMILLGCTPLGRHIEQHDIFFGIANDIKDLIPEIKDFWPEAKGKIHIDAWREVNYVDNFKIEVLSHPAKELQSQKLFFINLGGYKQNEFDELHYKMLIVASNKATAIKKAKQSYFYKTATFEKAESHIDNKYGVDVDDIFDIKEILTPSIKNNYSININAVNSSLVDEIHLGYFPLKSFL